MHSSNYNIGIINVDKNNIVKLYDLLSFISNTEYLGMLEDQEVMEYNNQHNIVSFITYRHLVLDNLPKFNDNITISTSLFKMNKYCGYRNSLVYANNEIVVKSYVESVFVNLSNYQITPIDPKLLTNLVYDNNDLTYHDKYNLDLTYTLIDKIKVKKDYIDIYNHLNNVKYLLINQEYIDFIPSSISIWYKKSATINEELTVFRYCSLEYSIIKLVNVNDEIVNIMKFNRRKI